MAELRELIKLVTKCLNCIKNGSFWEYGALNVRCQHCETEDEVCESFSVFHENWKTLKHLVWLFLWNPIDMEMFLYLILFIHSFYTWCQSFNSIKSCFDCVIRLNTLLYWFIKSCSFEISQFSKNHGNIWWHILYLADASRSEVGVVR